MHMEQQGFFVCDTITLQRVQEADMLRVSHQRALMVQELPKLELLDRCCCNSALAIDDK